MLVVFATLLTLLVVPYLGLMLVVIVGTLKRDPERMPHAAKPSVSVVLPAHNEEANLPATLASLMEQQYEGDVEFVVVDDRSSDGTADVVRAAAARDPRVRLEQITVPSKRYAPKVNAVREGIERSSGDIILTTDADCRYPEGWVDGMVREFGPGVTMVVGYVETTRRGGAKRGLHAFETIDWLSLMLVSRALTLFGWKFASSANNQAYLRSAFEAAGGFGAIARAPSGDEDLLTQKLGRLPGSHIRFASRPETRVWTQPIDSWGALLRQRRRWVSRYHHAMHYHPAFLASIAVLGFQSIAIAVSLVAAWWVDGLAVWLAWLWGTELLLQIGGTGLGALRFGRRDLLRPSLIGWAVLHPFFIATVVIWSFLKPGAWYSGAASYRRVWVARRWRSLSRRVKSLRFEK
jgi:cellulose synthase/poly-beta-1,6-N-acetylglucosamine synthase-like glycosyltransferase